MIEFIINNFSFIIFILILSLFLFLKRNKLEVQGFFPYMYMILFKTKLGLDKMDSWSKKHPKLFLYLSYLSIFIGVLGIIISILIMIWGLHFAIINNLGSGGGLVLPVKTDSGMDGTIPVFYVPFWYWLIALFVLVVVHEFAHGVIAQRFKIKVKSSGFAFGALLLPIMPAAFVEPDEKQLSKAKWWKQIAVFGAGSTSNFIFGFLFLLIWLFIAIPIVNNTMEIGQFQFNSVMNQSDLNKYYISSGEILKINNISNKDLFLEEIKNTPINSSINLTIRDQNNITNIYSIRTFENPNIKNKSMIGISNLKIELRNKKGFEYLFNLPLYFQKLFYYFWMLNIGIGIMNLLPIWITDGGQIMRVLLNRKFKEKTAIKLNNWISLFSLLLIILTIKPNLIMWIIN